MILFKLRSKGYPGLSFLLMILLLFSCNSGRLILKKEFSKNALKETKAVEIATVLQQEYYSLQSLNSDVNLESHESEEGTFA